MSFGPPLAPSQQPARAEIGRSAPSGPSAGASLPAGTGGTRKAAAAPRRFTGWRKWALRLALAVLAPTLLFGAVELALRLAGYGYRTSFFTPLNDHAVLSTNPRFAWRFMPREQATEPLPCRLAVAKPRDTVRIVVLGESAALGTPDPAFSFSRILEVMLCEQYPAARFEVVNAAMAGINSHVILPIARDSARQQPDLFILYIGNNEMVGPYGVGLAPNRTVPSLSRVRAAVGFKRTRVGQLLSVWTGGDGSAGDVAGPQSLDTFLANALGPDDPMRERVAANFRANLGDICRVGRDSGAAVVVCTVAANLRDCPPFASLHRSGLSDADRSRWQALYDAGAAHEKAGRYDEAVAQYAAAAQIDDRFAELRFRQGRCLLALGRRDEALTQFALARDLDGLPFRAGAALNQIVRQVAGEAGAGAPPGRVALIDVEQELTSERAAPQGIPGDDLFYEHAHLSFDGHYAVAGALWPHVQKALPAWVAGARDAAPPSRERCAELLAYGLTERQRAAASVARAFAHAPFTNQLDHAQRLTTLRRAVTDLERQMRGADWAAQDARYDAAVTRRPDDWLLRGNYALSLTQRGRHAEAAAQWRAIVRMAPDRLQFRLSLAEALLRANQGGEALSLYRQAVESAPHRADLHQALGQACMTANQLDGAVAAFEQAVRCRPNDAQVHQDLALALLAKGETGKARAELRRAAELRPEAPTWYHLGNIAGKAGQFDQAVEYYRKSLELDAGNASVENNLGAAYLALNQVESAITHLEEALRLNPQHEKAHCTLAEGLDRVGRHREAIDHYRQALKLRPRHPQAQVGLAWLLATESHPDLRNPEEAVRLAEEACRATGYRDALAVDVLAAAYAATGRFPEALRLANEAHRAALQAGNRGLADDIQHRVQMYTALKPYEQP